MKGKELVAELYRLAGVYADDGSAGTAYRFSAQKVEKWLEAQGDEVADVRARADACADWNRKLSDQVDWLMAEVQGQTGASKRDVLECMELSIALRNHVPVVNVRMGAEIRKRMLAEAAGQGRESPAVRVWTRERGLGAAGVGPPQSPR